jgi:hypothetical protein
MRIALEHFTQTSFADARITTGCSAAPDDIRHLSGVDLMIVRPQRNP